MMWMSSVYNLAKVVKDKLVEVGGSVWLSFLFVVLYSTVAATSAYIAGFLLANTPMHMCQYPPHWKEMESRVIERAGKWTVWFKLDLLVLNSHLTNEVSSQLLSNVMFSIFLQHILDWLGFSGQSCVYKFNLGDSGGSGVEEESHPKKSLITNHHARLSVHLPSL